SERNGHHLPAARPEGVDLRRHLPGPRVPRHRGLGQSRNRCSVCNSSAAERERQLGQGRSACSGADRVRYGPESVQAALRYERYGRDRYPAATQPRIAVRARRQQRGGQRPMNAASLPAPKRGLQRAMLTICAMTATIMQALDTTVANVALPYMQGSLSASLDQVNWILTSYIVASAILTAPVGWLAGRFGRKALFVVCTAGFTLASLLCGLAQSIEQMVTFRLLQGVFGAGLIPLSQAVMLDSYSLEERGQAMAIWGMGIMLGPIMGPTLGGWLTETYNWRWVFLINM